MKVVVVGAGPSGLYLAISLKLRNPAHDVTVVERNQPGDTYGWGVVFSDQTMENLTANDAPSARAMAADLNRWDYIDVKIRGRTERSGGHGFIGIGRRRMLEILAARAAELGVVQHYGVEVDLASDQSGQRRLKQGSGVDQSSLTRLVGDADLIVAADGLNSKIRNADLAGFQCDIELRPNKFVWLGTHQRFNDAFTFMFEQTEHGWVWAHAYQFDPQTSTFIVECGPQTYEKWGFARMSHEESAETCRRIFEKHLGGHPLLTNSKHIRGSAWISFPRVLCRNWVRGNVVLIGDAAHTAHFSIGSGTKLGFEDAISLARHLDAAGRPIVSDPIGLQDALKAYQAEREVEALKLQSAARNSMTWFEDIERYLDYGPRQFAYALLTRSQRVSHENLRLRDKPWLEQVERDFALAAGAGDARVPPMFTPFKLREMALPNRIVVSPMSMYSATDGVPDDWHLVHYGALAKGGAGLLFTEMTDVSAEGRISPGCAGLWNDAQAAAWTRIAAFVHGHSQAKFCVQLGHSGPKGSTKVGWEGNDVPLDHGNWPVIGPSAKPYSRINQVPHAMTRADMDRVRDDYVAAARRAERAGFDMLEMHYAHGYLMSAFITPVMNTRSDEYGGLLENRLRFPLEVFRAVRAVWPAHKPMSVRISSNDWVGEAGVTPAESVQIAKAFQAAGCDVIDVSAGQTTPDARPVYGRMFQTPFSDRIRNEARIATMAVGNIYEVDHVNSILASGRADLCCLARPHLVDPNWTLRAAAQQGYRGPAVRIPPQYEMGVTQMERNLKRAAEMVINA